MSRLSQQEVDQQLEAELTAFYNADYADFVPAGLIQIFKDAIFATAPIKHQIHVAKLRRIFESKETELITGDIGLIVNVINSTRLDWLYTDIESALNMHEKIEGLAIRYNTDVAMFKKSLDTKRRTLMQLVSPNLRNGGKIISAQA